MKKELLLIFKTHLDIGFTDYSQNVVDKYLKEYIPNAIRVGNELRDSDTPFIWTIGSWMVWEALKCDDGTVEQAIKDGILAWHALPFTSHTESMSVKLFEYGLSLSEKLDARFGKKTIAAKMTDVPGHTQAMVPIMAKHGIEFMHIGVNEVTPLPETPPIFKWKCDDSYLTVMYCTHYGNVSDFGTFAVAFAHTHDNKGPQSADEVREIYKKYRSEYPDADVKAVTLDYVAERLRCVEGIPILDKEIGDTWIHGIGTDPKKLGMYRELLRWFDNMGPNSVDISDNLLLVPEHTWGMDVKRYFPYWDVYYSNELKKYKNNPDKLKIESSWQEQRDYVYNGEKALSHNVDYTLAEPDVSVMTKVDIPEFDFELSWQIFDHSDNVRWIRKYMQLNPQTIIWGAYDYVKVGLPEYKGGIYTATATEGYEGKDGFWYKFEFESIDATKWGLPYFWVNVDGMNFTFCWFNKEASRIPQAAWLKFKGFDSDCEIRKLGRWIKPKDIIYSTLFCATDYGIRSDDKEIESLDAALVAPYGRRAYDFDLKPCNDDMYFNLYNNIWNTNFPQWYGEDTRFRFVIKQRNYK